jgi:hypothetical protein
VMLTKGSNSNSTGALNFSTGGQNYTEKACALMSLWGQPCTAGLSKALIAIKSADQTTAGVSSLFTGHASDAEPASTASGECLTFTGCAAGQHVSSDAQSIAISSLQPQRYPPLPFDDGTAQWGDGSQQTRVFAGQQHGNGQYVARASSIGQGNGAFFFNGIYLVDGSRYTQAC